jgi:hypothetical protein
MHIPIRPPCFFLLFKCFLLPALNVNAQANRVDDYVPVKANGKLSLALKGFWQSIGNGYIIDASSDSLLLYSYTTNFCYKKKNDYLEGLLNSQARFNRHGDTISIMLSDYGERSADLQITNHFFRIDKLPENHISFNEMQQLGPERLFELFIETMKENYAFSIERKID